MHKKSKKLKEIKKAKSEKCIEGYRLHNFFFWAPKLAKAASTLYFLMTVRNNREIGVR